MHDATSRSPNFRLGIAPGVPSLRLSALLALQRAHEPEVMLALSEVSGEELTAGLWEGRYDAGLSLQGVAEPWVSSQPLWSENMAVAMSLRCPLLDQAMLTIAELLALDYPVFRWQAETCPLLDQRLSSFLPGKPQKVQRVTSFELLVLWVAAGHGVGVSAQSRIEHAHAWGITMQPLSDGPYEVTTYLLRSSNWPPTPALERFGRRAHTVATQAT